MSFAAAQTRPTVGQTEGLRWDVPVGDPGEMREKAAHMGRQRDQLGHVSGRVDRAVAGMIYHCAAGQDLRRAVADRQARLQRVITEIQALQASILREAAELEVTQRDVARVVRDLTGP